jgi:septum formation protein
MHDSQFDSRRQRTEPRIVLASRSPRRLELAMREGWHVRVVEPPETAEASASARATTESLEAYVQRLALAKAQSVAALCAHDTIIACDTLGELDGIALGKPADRADAERMLRALSGRVHRVVTGVCVWQRPHAPHTAFAESFLVMDELSESTLTWYLDSGLWRGKAGACGFQDERLPLRLLSGSPSTVVGLPLELLRQLLPSLALSAAPDLDRGPSPGPTGLPAP